MFIFVAHDLSCASMTLPSSLRRQASGSICYPTASPVFMKSIKDQSSGLLTWELQPWPEGWLKHHTRKGPNRPEKVFVFLSSGIFSCDIFFAWNCPYTFIPLVHFYQHLYIYVVYTSWVFWLWTHWFMLCTPYPLCVYRYFKTIVKLICTFMPIILFQISRTATKETQFVVDIIDIPVIQYFTSI